MNARALVSEFVGTFALLLVGISSIFANYQSGGAVGVLGIALAHGFVIAAVASAVGPISGGHFNPAVTIGALLGGRIGAGAAAAYIVVQLVAALLGTLVAGTLFEPHAVAATLYGAPSFGASTTVLQAALAEGLFAFMLVFVVYGTAFFKYAPKIGALYVGLTVTFSAIVIGPLTGAGINPARYLGPALAAGDLSQALPYIIAPILGGAAAALLFNFVLEGKEDVNVDEKAFPRAEAQQDA
jgi:aquaporin TIP